MRGLINGRFGQLAMRMGVIAAVLVVACGAVAVPKWMDAQWADRRVQAAAAEHGEATRRNIDSLKAIGAQMENFPPVLGDGSLALKEKLRLSASIDRDAEEQDECKDVNAICVTDASLAKFQQQRSMPEIDGVRCRFPSKVAEGVVNSFDNGNPAFDADAILGNRFESATRRRLTPRHAELALQTTAAAKYAVVIRPREFAAPTAHENLFGMREESFDPGRFVAEALIFDLRSGGYLGGTVFEAVSSDSIDYSYTVLEGLPQELGRADEQDAALRNDLARNARSALITRLEESASVSQ